MLWNIIGLSLQLKKTSSVQSWSLCLSVFLSVIDFSGVITLCPEILLKLTFQTFNFNTVYPLRRSSLQDHIKRHGNITLTNHSNRTYGHKTTWQNSTIWARYSRHDLLILGPFEQRMLFLNHSQYVCICYQQLPSHIRTGLPRGGGCIWGSDIRRGPGSVAFSLSWARRLNWLLISQDKNCIVLTLMF